MDIATGLTSTKKAVATEVPPGPTQYGVPWSSPDLSAEEHRAVAEVLASGWLGMGPRTKEFERGLSSYTGAKQSVVVNNGTAGLLTAFLANGIGPGDEVLAPTYTFAATVNSIIALGAKPVLVDCDPGTLNVTPETVETAMRGHDRIKAIVFVDVAGQPCDIDPLVEIGQRYAVPLIEDAAEAFGAGYRGKVVGGYDHTTVFSFHVAKQLTTVEGGAVVTNNAEIAAKCRLIRSHGEGPDKYVHVALGLNFRPTDIQSAIGIVQLRKVDRFLQLRGELARCYRESLQRHLEFQEVPDFVSQPTWMIFMALCRGRTERDEYVRWLNSHGIDTRIPWPPVHAQPFYVDRFGPSAFPSADHAYSRVLSLPIGNGLSLDQIRNVVDCSIAFFEGAGR
ncbi:MAG: DegT/DnrJ/EryC1/StrS aminotransferase family protein [Thermoplasmata archaeon]